MNKTEMLFVRHGESAANLNGVYVGHIDSPLSDKGRVQAKMTAEFLKDKKIDAFYASDLSRAFETACIIAEKHKKDVIPDKNLREIYAGEWEGKKFSDLPALYEKTYGIWLSDIGRAHPDGGESVDELYKRVTGETVRIARKNMGKTVLIATHATPIRVLTCFFKGIDLHAMKNVPWVHNASVTAADFYEDGRIELVFFDKFDFMGKSATALPKNV